VLHKAARTGDVTTMRILIDSGADIHAPGQVRNFAQSIFVRADI
jgi:hypothetical protein